MTSVVSEAGWSEDKTKAKAGPPEAKDKAKAGPPEAKAKAKAGPPEDKDKAKAGRVEAGPRPDIPIQGRPRPESHAKACSGQIHMLYYMTNATDVRGTIHKFLCQVMLYLLWLFIIFHTSINTYIQYHPTRGVGGGGGLGGQLPLEGGHHALVIYYFHTSINTHIQCHSTPGEGGATSTGWWTPYSFVDFQKRP